MSQKRLLTSEKSKLADTDLSTILRKEDAWDNLPLEKRQELYALLPTPAEGELVHNPDINPLKTSLRPFVEEALRQFQEELREGREGKKWRAEALQAGADRWQGKFDELKESDREKYWGGADVKGGKTEETTGEEAS